MLGFAMRFSGPAQLGRYAGPSLELSFEGDTYAMGDIGSAPQNKAYSDLITFTRASGGGITNAAGQFEWVGNNVPRITYDPVTLKRLGQLIEEQRTNLLLQSADFANSTWSKLGSIVVTPVVKGQRIDFPANLDLVVQANQSIAANTPCTVFVIAARDSGKCTLRISNGTSTQTVRATIDTSAKTLTFKSVSGTGVFASASVTPFESGWDIYALTGSFTAAQTGMGLMLVREAASETSITVLGSQFEAGSSASSYIPTTTAQVTRAADYAAVNTLSPWYNASEGTLVIVANTGAGVTPHYASFLTSTGSSYEGLRAFRQTSTGTDRLAFRDSGGPDVIINSAVVASKKRAISYKFGGDVSICADGGAVSKASIAAESTPAITRLFIGSLNGAALFLNGIISSITYYPRVIDVQQASA